jgi:hypothetical protein
VQGTDRAISAEGSVEIAGARHQLRVKTEVAPDLRHSIHGRDLRGDSSPPEVQGVSRLDFRRY